MNFLRDNGTAGWKWDAEAGELAGQHLATLATLGSYESLKNCPHNDNLTGRLEFWVAQAATPTGVVIYQHGVTSSKETFVAVAKKMAEAGFSTVAMDLWKHGSRAYYEDVTGDGLIDDSSIDPEFFLRPGPDIAMSVGYFYQSEWDIRRLVAVIQNNREVYEEALGLFVAPTTANTFFYGHSLGAMMGVNLLSGTPVPTLVSEPKIGSYVLAAPGGDITDTVLNGRFRETIVGNIVASDPIGYDVSTVIGAVNLNSTLSAIEMISTHGLFKGFVDQLNRANYVSTTPVLIQQMEGDLTVPNNNTTLLKYGMLTNHRYADGDGSRTDSRASWDYEACQYGLTIEDNASLLHSAFFNWEDTPTVAERSQLQAAGFFGSQSISDPSAGLTGICN